MDRRLEIKIDSTLSGKTIKEILKNRFKISTAILTELKETPDGILLNSEKVFVNIKAEEGSCLVVNMKDKRSDIDGKNIPLDIIFEDEDIIVVNKGRGMPIHPSLNHYDDTLANALMYYFSDENFTFRVITRLDKDTSGVVLLAKNPLSGAILSEEMKNGNIEKEYIALVNGTPSPCRGRIDAPIKRKSDSVILRCVAPDGKEAVTEYETIKEKGDLSLLKLHPKTGRTHQIRVHLSYIGHPIYGDDLYGAKQREEKVRLHCGKISFRHPITGESLSLSAEIPSDISREIE